MSETTPKSQPVAKPKLIDTTVPAAAEPEVPVEELSPEEQMARFEKELREDDWGHQPC